jgi:hypothetical protein
MTDVELCYGSADGVALSAQALYREKFPARPVPHSQTFLAVVYGKMVLRSVNRGQRAYAILKTGRKPVNKYPAVMERKRYIFHSPPKGGGLLRLSRAFSATLTGRFGMGTVRMGAEGRW